MFGKRNLFTVCALLIGLCICLMIMAAIGGSTYTYTGAQTQSSPHWGTYPAGCGASAAGDQLNITSVFTECIVSRTQDLPSPNDSFWFTAVVTAVAAGMEDTGVVDSGVGLGVSDGDKYMRVHLIKDNGEAKVALVTGGVPDASLSIAADWIDGPVIVTLYRYGTTVGIEVGKKQITESYWDMDDDDPLYKPRVIFGHIVATTRTSTWHTLEWSISSEEVLPVAIDIKPGGCPNPLNVKSKGVLSVAILGKEDFDVFWVDVATVTLRSVAPIHPNGHYEDVSAPIVGSVEECECTEAGPDGFPDLVLHFDIQEIVGAMGEVSDGDEVLLQLDGMLIAGISAVTGSDCVVIRKKGK